MSRSAPQISVLLVGLLLAPPAAQAQWQKNEYQMQKEHLAQFEPAPLVAPRRGGSASPTVMRLRFYADEAYRAGGGRWAERLKGQLLDMNRVVGPAFGVRFEAESFRRWDRRGPAGALAPVLQELEQLDAGEDVDWVVGLCSPLPTLTMSFHDLGMARQLGRHFVLRGMSSLAEMDDFQRIFKALDQVDREKLYGKRKAHKEMSVFLHEWAHTLGAPHVEDATRIMSPGYSQRTSAFSLEDAELISAALAGRLGSRGRGETAIDWSALREHLQSVRNPQWMASELQELKSLLARQGPAPAGPGGPATQAGPAAIPVPPPASLFGRPRVTPPPAPPPVAASTAPGQGATATGRTQAPATLGPATFAVYTQARALVQAGKRPEALALIQQAEDKVTGEPAARGATLADLARLYAEHGAFTAAERALEKSGGLGSDAAPAAAADVQRLRRYYSVPAGNPRFQLAPEQELTHAEVFDQVRAALREEKTSQAQTLVTAGLKQLPKAPSLLTLACEIELRLGRPRAAIPRCKQALAVTDDLPRAHYVLGCAQAEAGQIDPALKSLKRAIALDPAEQNAWRSLGDLYRALGRSHEYTKFLAANPPPEAAAKVE